MPGDYTWQLPRQMAPYLAPVHLPSYNLTSYTAFLRLGVTTLLGFLSFDVDTLMKAQYSEKLPIVLVHCIGALQFENLLNLILNFAIHTTCQ